MFALCFMYKCKLNVNQEYIIYFIKLIIKLLYLYYKHINTQILTWTTLLQINVLLLQSLPTASFTLLTTNALDADHPRTR